MTEDFPESIGPYKIEALLNKGGMSYLYLATDPETKTPVALKVLSPKYIRNEEAKRRFQNEASIIEKADHPNIVGMRGNGEWEGSIYIAMDFIEGVSLKQYLLKTPLSLKRALHIINEIAYALCHLHSHGIIHRDLKPENILLNQEGEVKVIDFGIAQLPEEKWTKEERRRIIGTPIYMSPEQKKDPTSVSYPSDIYSLGIIAYELLLGRLCHGQVYVSLTPNSLRPIISKMLRPDPLERYQSAVDLLSDLSDYRKSGKMEKERKFGDPVTELFEDLIQIQHLLDPKIPPDIGYCRSREIPLTSQTAFFSQPASHLTLLLIVKTAADSAKGMLRLIMLHNLVKPLLKKRTLSSLFEELNHHLNEDSLTDSFDISALMLDSEKKERHYLCFGQGVLWIRKKGADPMCRSAPHPRLAAATTFSPLIEPWCDTERLILTNLAPSLTTDHRWRDLLLETTGFTPSKEAALLHKTLSIALPNSPFAICCY